jgi:hypothetical protein
MTFAGRPAMPLSKTSICIDAVVAVRLLLRADAGCGVKISDSQESIRHVVQAAGKASTTQAARGGWGRSLLYRGVRSTPMARAGERGVVGRSSPGAAVGVAETWSSVTVDAEGFRPTLETYSRGHV